MFLPNCKAALIAVAIGAVCAGEQAVAQDKKTTKPTTTKVKKASNAMTKPTTPTEMASYAIGADIARNLKQQGITFNLDMLVQAMRDVTAGNTLSMTDKEMQDSFRTLQSEVQKKSQAKNDVLADKNKAEGKAFLDANATKEGVKTTPSGLQYLVLTEGTGAKPAATDTVKTHYHGTLIDGTVFDSSVDRKEPATFPVNGVIKGWQEALVLMNVGSKYRLFVPAELAYGDRGAGPKIGPNSTLVFEVELLSIQGK
jgi:FKBP-type peptidyl-prolyl cis-trans isomerase FklB